MKLWKLDPGREDMPPWNQYDTAESIVVRAETEKRAREIADDNAGCERFCEIEYMGEQRTCNSWLEKEITSCVELKPEGDEGIVIIDFNAG